MICCRDALATKELVDMWLTAADLYASFQDVQGVKQVFRATNVYNLYMVHFFHLEIIKHFEVFLFDAIYFDFFPHILYEKFYI